MLPATRYNLRRAMTDFWTRRRSCYGALIWWFSFRYLLVGLEFVLDIPPHSSSAETYTEMFGSIPAKLVGALLIVGGALGFFAQIFRLKKNYFPKRILLLFAMSVILNSLFRLTMLLQGSNLADPLVILFSCDLVAMIFLLHGVGGPSA